ncbi:lamin tail domain-containing protein [Acholeplasma hippikon]|uniref:Endonuclease yncB n=1 Tax=Acholeplasma hippikon TaxID=264636 RepID=A0A449BKS1_9MOLU|nr:lamin tail domain-containing protein [Acholeplasma hippikon]VEU83049.1 Endonuclease yncB precursor [Acholeplasma hippikon]
MKKTLLSIIFVFAAFVLVACGKNEAKPLVISKVYTSEAQEDNLIELYNASEKAIELKNYSIQIYTNGSKEVNQTIALTGSIESEGYYVIGSSFHTDSNVKAKIDLVYENFLPFNGNDAIELAYNKKGIDLVGTIGSDSVFAFNLTIIRTGLKEEYAPSMEYKFTKFISYVPNAYQYLKNDNHEIKTVEDILKGPKLEQRYLETTYVNPTRPTVGNGGVITTTLQSIADGDTAWFVAKDGFPGGSVRYYYINTPEVNGSYVNAQPWGYVASKYNKEYLLVNASTKTLQLQSIPNYSLTEGNGRNLSLVWVNGHLSQFMIAAEGLTQVPLSFESYDLLLTYKDIPYLTFLKFAEENAKANGWGIHGYPTNPNGEKSPDWNYQANGGVGALATTNPNWKPHLPLPW